MIKIQMTKCIDFHDKNSKRIKIDDGGEGGGGGGEEERIKAVRNRVYPRAAADDIK